MLVVRGNALARSLGEIVAARGAVVSIASGTVAGDAAAALLFSDWAVMEPDSTLRIDSPSAYAGAIWRLRDGQSALALAASPDLSAADAEQLRLCDEISDGADFLGNRSEVALDAAATLIARRGGDALERATFAWLFATGTPAEGLTAFLEKRRPRFDRTE